MKKIYTPLIIFFFFTQLLTAQVVPTLNLEAWYNFTGNTADSSTNMYNGTNHGAVLTTDRHGYFNQAYDFTSPGYIDCNNILNSTFAGAGKQFTVSFWVKPAGANNNNIILAKHSDAGCGIDQREFFIRSLNNTVNVEYYGDNAGTLGRFVCGTVMMTNTTHWYHIVVTYDGTINTNNGLDRVKIYVDNVSDATSLSCRVQSGSFPFDMTSGLAHFGIGNYLTTSGTPCLTSTNYSGDIDDIRIYSRKLTGTEITQLYYENTAGILTYSDRIDLKVYPNPASDIVTVELPALEKGSEMKIKNILGQTIYSEPVYSSTEFRKEIKIADFPKGIYFIEICSGNKVTGTEKMIVQ